MAAVSSGANEVGCRAYKVKDAISPCRAAASGGDEPVTRRVFFGTLAERLGLKSPRLVPAWPAPLRGSTGRLMTRSLRISNRKLKEATGWSRSYPSVREGFAATLAEMGLG
jgi:nucleoside-diphosphate-sugar epimerase